MNPLIDEYIALAASLDALIQQLVAEQRPIAAHQVGAAQGQLRAACQTMIANDINAILDPDDPGEAVARKSVTDASHALRAGAAAIANDENKVTTIVGLATAATQIASSIVPPNIPELIAAARETIGLLS